MRFTFFLFVGFVIGLLLYMVVSRIYQYVVRMRVRKALAKERKVRAEEILNDIGTAMLLDELSMRDDIERSSDNNFFMED